MEDDPVTPALSLPLIIDISGISAAQSWLLRTGTIELDGTCSIYPHHLVSKSDFKLKQPPPPLFFLLTYRTFPTIRPTVMTVLYRPWCNLPLVTSLIIGLLLKKRESLHSDQLSIKRVTNKRRFGHINFSFNIEKPKMI